MRLIDLTGKKFGRLTVLERVENQGTQPSWLCMCDCGVEKIITGGKLRSGVTKSCGCFRVDNMTKISTKHGYSKSPLYQVWVDMRRRCTDERRRSYKTYGARGISVCNEWNESFKSFESWCLDSEYKKGLQIDRINNDGDYEPSNCRFVSLRKNILNKDFVSLKANTSGYVGVRVKGNKWSSNITILGDDIYLGTFEKKEYALEERNMYIIKNNLQDDYKVQQWNE